MCQQNLPLIVLHILSLVNYSLATLEISVHVHVLQRLKLYDIIIITYAFCLHVEMSQTGEFRVDLRCVESAYRWVVMAEHR